VFLSIGYYSCHWCHVMAKESFEDESVAKILNENFVSVKIDREQRPDIDNVYMRACQAATGGGGWPMSVFTDSAGNPFFVGTYYPKELFVKILLEIAVKWKNNKEKLLIAGERFSDTLRRMETTAKEKGVLSQELETAAFLREYDNEYGGFGTAPKFPTPQNIMFLLYTAPFAAEKTLDCMYKGGIFDHIGGGFSRYSTDRYWLAPHFEKMLYDNALLAIAYSMGYEILGKKLYKHVVERIFEYMERDLASPEGGFYSSQDADSEGEEGKFYLFSKSEILDVLGEKDGEDFCIRYGINESGNFHGKSILNLLNSADLKINYDGMLKKLFNYRKNRIPPNIDKKILTSWNCLAAAAYAVAGRIFLDKKYILTAEKMCYFIETNLMDDDCLVSSVTNGKKSSIGFLDDYAFYVFALIQTYQATMNEKYLSHAAKIAKATHTLFSDSEGGYYFSSEKHEKLITRTKETYDGATPSGNSMIAYNFSRLSLLTEDKFFYSLYEKQSEFMESEAAALPTGFGFFMYSSLPVKKVVCVPEKPETLAVRSDWAFTIGDIKTYPLSNGKTTFYVCENGICRPPANEI
ncbi:MAG: thioredoxin domain-containing protein, partial [Clostridia bacterium]|nr:thioredoxin domain-containing protein [Clostridia bacterium]